jgi:prevent-host-death family protein
MVVVETANIVELKSRLSHFLQLVQRGAEVVVTSHRHPVGKLVPYSEKDGMNILPARHASQTLRKIKGVKPLRAVDVVGLLRAERDRR